MKNQAIGTPRTHPRLTTPTRRAHIMSIYDGFSPYSAAGLLYECKFSLSPFYLLQRQTYHVPKTLYRIDFLQASLCRMSEKEKDGDEPHQGECLWVCAH